jgi:hypothetical protein
MALKSTWFFSDVGRAAGWSETYYHSIGSLDLLKAAVLVTAVDRATCLSKDAVLLAVRLSDPANPRKTLLVDYETNPFAKQAWDGAYPWNALLIRVTSQLNHKRPIYLRDVPAAIVDEENPLNAVVGFANALNAWINDLKTVLLMQVRFTTPYANPPGDLISSIAVDLVGQVTVTTQVAHGMANGFHTVQVSQVQTFPQLNRTWRVNVTGASTFVLLNAPVPPIGYPALNPQGRYREVKTDFDAFKDASVERVVHRDTGRPFNLQRGRARARR